MSTTVMILLIIMQLSDILGSFSFSGKIGFDMELIWCHLNIVLCLTLVKLDLVSFMLVTVKTHEETLNCS